MEPGGCAPASLPLDQRISLSVELKTTQANKQAINKQTNKPLPPIPSVFRR